MNVVASCGWLEYFADGPNVDFFSGAIENTDALIVPVISLYEVFKRAVQQHDENAALQAVTLTQQGQVAELDAALALNAARLSHAPELPPADSLVLATARRHGATLWTPEQRF